MMFSRLMTLMCALTLVAVTAPFAVAQDTQEMRLSLREAIDLALENNLDIAAQRSHLPLIQFVDTASV